VNGLWLRAAADGRHCAPAALDWRFWAAPQLHGQAALVVGASSLLGSERPWGLSL
jgi:hypothetical protein